MWLGQGVAWTEGGDNSNGKGIELKIMVLMGKLPSARAAVFLVSAHVCTHWHVSNPRIMVP